MTELTKEEAHRRMYKGMTVEEIRAEYQELGGMCLNLSGATQSWALRYFSAVGTLLQELDKK
jgi:hypothetical protein